MRKLPSGEETAPITFRARKTVLDVFYKEADRVNLRSFPGKFFESIFEDWLEFKKLKGPQDQRSSGKGVVKRGSVVSSQDQESEHQHHHRKAG